MSRRISAMLHEIILPLSHNVSKLPPKTSFVYTSDDSLRAVFSNIRRDCPQLLQDKRTFMDMLEKHFDAHQLALSAKE